MRQQIAGAALGIVLTCAMGGPGHAGLGDELRRWKDDVGDVLEGARDDVKRLAEEAIGEAEKVARKARAEGKRLEARVRKLRDEVQGELAKIGGVGEAINEMIDVTEATIEASGDVIQSNVDMIGKIETAIVEQKLDPYEIVIDSSSSILGNKLAQAISGDKINELLDTEIAGELKVIDVLLPIQSGLERLDATGMQECIRKGVVAKGANGGMALAGAPEQLFENLSDSGGLEVAATKVVGACLNTHVVRRPESGEGALSAEELAKAEAERDVAIADMKANEAETARAEEYYAEMKLKYDFYSDILDDTKALAEEAEHAKQANEKVARKLAETMKQAGLDPESFAGILE
ncbi:hypothetical protein KHC17_28150 (plasmid) [Agrobacterium salinitolerans]|uniref:hypothetical protein n=1 Tax=Agrobacterium salinitolerans TaxID=1183413 RepID=UPI001C22A9A6|nr:hypothetical protein [Agrobacterium salinitolerans]QXC52982.1 hypothetical protein KHC17_28150 [Agrobacterium salinitolerans]